MEPTENNVGMWQSGKFKLTSTIILSVDDGRITALTLLDLSDAFTTDFTILLGRLGDWFVNKNAVEH